MLDRNLYDKRFWFIFLCYFSSCIATQGDLASKFPIYILTRTQGQHRSWIWEDLKNHKYYEKKNKKIEIGTKFYTILLNIWHVCSLWVGVKWRILSRPSKIGSDKNTKKNFLLGLKFTLRTCFEYKNFSSNSCPELSNQVLSFSAGQIC